MTLRKILGAFKISSSAAIEIEARVKSITAQLNYKTRAYASRVMTLAENHPIRLQTPITFPGPGTGLDLELDLEGTYKDWDEPDSDLRAR